MNDDLISRAAAIDILDAYQVMVENGEENPYAWARLRMSELPSAQPEKLTTAEKSQLAKEKSTRKLIYLDDAIRIVESFYKVNADIRRIMAFELRQLPPAQPEIVRCKDCKYHWTHRCMDSMPTEICELDQTFYDANVDFCSLAERRTDGGLNQQTGGD